MKGTTHDIAGDTSDLSSVFRIVYRRWVDAKGERSFPAFKEFPLEVIPPKILPWCSIVDKVQKDGQTDFRFRFWGTERVKLVGGELTGCLFSELEVKETRETAFATFYDMFERPRPSVWDMPIVTPSGRAVVLSFLRLPLLDDTGEVSHVFSVLDEDSITPGEYKGFGTEPPLDKLDNF